MNAEQDRAGAQTSQRSSRAVPLYLFGDSTTLIHRDRLVTSQRSGTSYITRTMYCPGIRGWWFSGNDGLLDPEVMNGLKSERLLVDEDDGTLAVYDRARASHWKAASLIEGSPERRAVLAFSVGGLDVPAVVADLGANFDVELPRQFGSYSAVDSARRVVSFDAVRGKFRHYFGPLERGLQTLLRWGFKSLYVHSLPPTQDGWERHVKVFMGAPVPLRVRAKLLAIGNVALREMCVRNSVAFLDAWPIVASGGVMRSEFSYDYLHYNSAAAALITAVQIAHVEQHGVVTAPQARSTYGAARITYATRGFVPLDIALLA